MNGCRYVLFAGESYYPIGGALDIQGAADSAEELKALLGTGLIDLRPGWAPDWWHILDLQTGEIVEREGMACGMMESAQVRCYVRKADNESI